MGKRTAGKFCMRLYNEFIAFDSNIYYRCYVDNKDDNDKFVDDVTEMRDFLGKYHYCLISDGKEWYLSREDNPGVFYHTNDIPKDWESLNEIYDSDLMSRHEKITAEQIITGEVIYDYDQDGICVH